MCLLDDYDKIRHPMKGHKPQKTKSLPKCYMCARPGTTDEHAPPRCFFPDGPKQELIKVPSCPTHNEANSKDVEYVRNVITGSWGINGVGEEVQKKALRSFDKSPKLLRQTFGDITPVIKDGEETGAFSVNLIRLNKVMKCIAYALYYNDFQVTYPYEWWIYGGSLVTKQSLSNMPDHVNAGLRAAFEKLTISDKHTNHPEVFKYGMYQDNEHHTVYRFEFYEAVFIYAYGTPKVNLFKPKIYVPK